MIERKGWIVLLVAVCCALAGPKLRAEVAVDRDGATQNTIIMGAITDDPNPIGVWYQLRLYLPPAQVLNESGDVRGDGRPNLAYLPTGEPVVVWSYAAGADYDIALSEWDGSTWTPTVFLTSNSADEKDPRIAVEPDGTLHVVWWKNNGGNPATVHVSSRPGGGGPWSPPVQVSDGLVGSRRPAITVHQGTLRVAYETDTATPATAHTDVVVATEGTSGGFTYEIIASTDRKESLEVEIHSEAGKLWCDWIHEETDFGDSRKTKPTGWTPVNLQPSDGTSWIEVEEARRRSRQMILYE